MAGNLFNQVQALLHTPQPPQLGPGPRAHVESAASIRTKIEDLTRQANLPALRIDLLHALVLLWHDRLEASHRIVQEIETPDGSLIHAMMHRREPDYWNSKYWWRRVGTHPVFPALADAVTRALQDEPSPMLARIVNQGNWDPLAFVDECQQAAPLPATEEPHRTAVEVQRIEFQCALAHLCA